MVVLMNNKVVTVSVKVGLVESSKSFNGESWEIEWRVPIAFDQVASEICKVIVNLDLAGFYCCQIGEVLRDSGCRI
jgi:hypothetical protein